jgi:hypothetical protein
MDATKIWGVRDDADGKSGEDERYILIVCWLQMTIAMKLLPGCTTNCPTCSAFIPSLAVRIIIPSRRHQTSPETIFSNIACPIRT